MTTVLSAPVDTPLGTYLPGEPVHVVGKLLGRRRVVQFSGRYAQVVDAGMVQEASSVTLPGRPDRSSWVAVQAALFDMAPVGGKVGPLSLERRLTVRALNYLRAGRHPVTGWRLSVDAAPVEDRRAPGLRCGSCQFFFRSARYFKCHLRSAHSAQTDLRAWWPACCRHVDDGVTEKGG